MYQDKTESKPNEPKITLSNYYTVDSIVEHHFIPVEWNIV